MKDLSAATDDFIAFLSYSHHDESIAERLLRFLDHYRYPSALRKKCPHLPKRPGHLFRDKESLRTQEIQSQLWDVLSGCRYLIVICTPHSAAPNEIGKHYPDEGLAFFHALNPELNDKRIIALMYRGAEHAPDERCLPPFIIRHKIPYIDVEAIGEERAFNAVAAALGELNPKALWDGRNRARLVKRRIILSLILALFSAFSWVCSELFMDKEEIYSAYTWKGGEGVEALIPIGIPESKITPREFKNRRCAFVFTYRHNKLIQISHQTSSHHELGFFPPCRLNDDGYHGIGAAAIIQLHYDSPEQPDKVTSMSFLDAMENLILTIADDGKDTIRLHSGESVWMLGNQLMGLAAAQPRGKQGIPFYRFASVSTDADGIMNITYLDNQKKPLSGPGIRGCRFHLEKGTNRLLRGEWVGETEGVSALEFHYVSPQHCGHLACMSSYNLRGKLMDHLMPTEKHAGAVRFIEWDPHGNAMRVAVYNKDGKRLSDYHIEYDQHGRLRSLELDLTGTEAAHPITLCQEILDSTTEMRTFRDSLGRPCRHPDGYARYRFSHASEIFTEEFMDEEGNPCTVKGEEYTKIYFVVDSKSRRIEEGYLRAEGDSEIRVLHSGGYHLVKRTYDESDELKKEEFFDTNGNSIRTVEY